MKQFSEFEDMFTSEAKKQNVGFGKQDFESLTENMARECNKISSGTWELVPNIKKYNKNSDGSAKVLVKYEFKIIDNSVASFKLTSTAEKKINKIASKWWDTAKINVGNAAVVVSGTMYGDYKIS